jgi:hypothetical protein
MREVNTGLSIVNHFDAPMRAGAVPLWLFAREPAEMSQVKLLQNGRLFDRAGVAKLADAQDLKS